MNDPNFFIENAWRQGDIIDDKPSVQELLKVSSWPQIFHSQPPDFLVVLSQNCDILKTEEEPFIDLLEGFFDKKDGNYFHGKNPRRLQIEFKEKIIGFSISNILRITKDEFKKITPKHSSVTLDKKDIKQIINWISRRYARAAFPDEFNNRLSEAKQRIDKTQKDPLMDKVSLIFVDITDEELKPDQDYNVTMIVGVCHGSNYEIISKVEDIFYEAFDISGIDVNINVYDEYDITYEIIFNYKRFDWDFRSLPENPETSAPASGIDTV